MSHSDVWVMNASSHPSVRVRLFCLPHAGGSAQMFASWRQQLPSEIQVCPIQLPGRHRRLREPTITSMPRLVTELAHVLRRYSDVPYAIFGQCMGGLIGFELARQLQEEDAELPCHLFVSSYPAPQLLQNEPPSHDLSNEDFIKHLQRIEGTPPDVLTNSELLGLVLPVLRADFTLCETYTYVPRPQLSCPITVIGALDDRDLSRLCLPEWCIHTHAACTVRMYSGDKFSLLNNQELLTDINLTLRGVHK